MKTEIQHVSPDELRKLLQCLAEIRLEMNSFPKIAKQDNLNFIRDAPPDFSWAEAYSLNLLEMVALLVVLAGLTDEIKDVSKDNFVFDAIQEADIELIDFGEGIEYSKYQFTALTFALIKSLHALQLYGRSLNTMLRQIVAGDQILLFEAIKVDSTFVSNPEIATFLAKAELRGDKGFKKKLTNAINGVPNARRQSMSPFRFAVHCLEELGQFDSMSEDEIYNLLVVELGLYTSQGEGRETFHRKVREYRAMSRIEISHNSIREKADPV